MKQIQKDGVNPQQTLKEKTNKQIFNKHEKVKINNAVQNRKSL